MNLLLWITAGVAIAWARCVLFNGNAARSLVPSLVIGVTGAVVGGMVLAPHIGTTMENVADFNPFALLVAGAVATGFVVIGDLVFRRHGV